MKPIVFALPCLLTLASCSSPPQPPSVDETTRRPANARAEVDLQSCKGDLQNTRLLALDNARAAQSSGSSVARLVQQQALMQFASASAGNSGVQGAANIIRTVHFAFGSAQVALPEPDVRQLADEARIAPLIVLRGRTDGSTDSPAESRIARRRAEAVRDLLVHAGTDATRIRITWQPSGDPVADNDTPAGRARNRRVEIEIYRALPQAADPGSSGVAAAG